VKEKPILFSAPMVRAILAGNKTQTRRIVKNQPFDRSWSKHDHQIAITAGRAERGDEVDGLFAYSTSSGGEWQAKCPFGQPGDRLWVRETWSSDFANHYPHDRIWYAADDDRRHAIEARGGVRGIYSPESGVHVPFRWRPSIHMPRTASRILLEITDVRVERLNTISFADAQAEGWQSMINARPNDYDPISWYKRLWAEINGDGSWNANRWVWVVEFRMVEA